LGNGDGTFQPAKTYNVGTQPYYLTAADLTGSGTLDLVVANDNHGTANGGSVSILMGNGDGTFQNAVSLPDPGNGPVAVAAGDVAADLADLVVASYAATPSPKIFPSTGTSAGVPLRHPGLLRRGAAPTTWYWASFAPPAVASGHRRQRKRQHGQHPAQQRQRRLPSMPSHTYSTGGGNPFRLVTLSAGGNVGLAVANYNSNNVGVHWGQRRYLPGAVTYTTQLQSAWSDRGRLQRRRHPRPVSARLERLPPDAVERGRSRAGTRRQRVVSGYGRARLSGNSDDDVWVYRHQETLTVALDALAIPALLERLCLRPSANSEPLRCQSANGNAVVVAAGADGHLPCWWHTTATRSRSGYDLRHPRRLVRAGDAATALQRALRQFGAPGAGTPRCAVAGAITYGTTAAIITSWVGANTT
jgi:hypothetical protein